MKQKHIKCVPSRGNDGEEKRQPCPLISPALVWALWLKLRSILSGLTVEPVMLLDGLAYSVVIVFMENLQMDKICLVNLNLTSEVCNNLSNYNEKNIEMQQYFSVFGMYNGIITAFIPLFFILFMGAWSDKYGRKVPLYIATMGHFCLALGYLLNSWVTKWPVEYLLVAALIESFGGGTVSFITAANAYISDVSSEETRTTKLGLATSFWYLGGPIGTLLGTYIYKYGGYQILFGTSLMMHTSSLVYLFFLPESHGPFAKHLTKEKGEEQNMEQQQQQDKVQQQPITISLKKPSQLVDSPNKISVWQMVADFFNYGRIVDSIRCTFKPRVGFVRAFILLLILCNLLRRLGRGAYMYLFTRRVLGWRETDYGFWVTYKNLLSAIGSLFAVPLLSWVMGMSDNFLAILGAFSSVADYTTYGLVSKDAEFLIWIAPVTGILVNSCVIAIRSMLSKFVTGDELGKVSAMLGALDGVMPMISFSLYTAIYHVSVHVFPGAQFFFGASVNLLMTLIFIFIIYFTTSRSYSVEDLSSGETGGAVEPKSLRFTNGELFTSQLEPATRHQQVTGPAGGGSEGQVATTSADVVIVANHHQRSVTSTPEFEQCNVETQRTTLILSGVNFHLGTPKIKKGQAIRIEGNVSNGIFNITEITSLDKQRIQDELTFPQKYSIKRSSSQKKNKGEEERGVDNLAYTTNTEEENKQTVQSNVTENLTLSLQCENEQKIEHKIK